MLPDYKEQRANRLFKESLEKIVYPKNLGLHNIYTPSELVNEMLDKIPNLEDKSILIMFNLEFIFELKNRLGKENLSNIYFATNDLVLKSGIAQSLGINKNNIIYIDYNKKEIKLNTNMPKFDVVIANPPYKGNLHLKFLEIAYNVSNQYVVFLQPATIYLDKKGKSKQVLDLKELIKNNIKEITLLNANYLFNIYLAIPFSLTVINKNKSEQTIKVIDKINETVYNINNLVEINKWGNNLSFQIENKILKFAKKDNLLNYRNKDRGKYYINLPKIIGHIYNNKTNKFYKDDFYNFLHKNAKIDNNISNKNFGLFYLSFKTKDEAENAFKYLKNKIIRFALSIYKYNLGLNRGELKGVPYLDFTQEWTDEKLKEYFGLTDEEYNFIQKVIPDYYPEDFEKSSK